MYAISADTSMTKKPATPITVSLPAPNGKMSRKTGYALSAAPAKKNSAKKNDPIRRRPRRLGGVFFLCFHDGRIL